MQNIHETQSKNVDEMDDEKKKRFLALEKKLKEITPKMVDMKTDIGICSDEYLVMEKTVEKITEKINSGLEDGDKKLDENKGKKKLSYVEGVRTKFGL